MNRGMYAFRKKMTWLVLTITSVVFFVWLCYILKFFYLTNFQLRVYGVPTVLVRSVLTLLGLGALWGFYRLLSFRTVQRIIQSRSFPFWIIAVTFLTRLAWLFPFGEFKPFSDFALYLTLASSISATGNVPANWQWYVSFAPYVLGYASFLAVLFTIFGQSLVVAQIANAVFSGLIAVLLFLIGKKLTGKTEIGVLAAALLIVMPSQAAMTLYPATELPYITLMLAATYVCLSIPNHRVRIPDYGLCAIALILTVLMNEIRPLGILTLAAFCVFYVAANRFTGKRTIRNILMIVLLLAAYFTASSLLNNLKEDRLGLPIARNAYGYGLYLGMNYSTIGHWGPEDAKLEWAAETSRINAQQFHQQMIGLAMQRFDDLIHHNLLFHLLRMKVTTFWSNPNIFLQWITEIAEATPNNIRIVKALTQVSDGIYGIVILFSVMESVLLFRRKDYAYYSRSMFIKVMLIAILVMHAIFDANERYVTPAFPLLVLLAAGGFQEAVDLLVPLFTRLARNKAMSVSRSF